MADRVQDQYEAFPYPERDPADEDTRLITGSPSRPDEIDHYLFGGARDWTQTFRVLFAGGGTGDGLIQLAQGLTDAGRPYEITYLDLSTASRAIAEARAARRGLQNIRFVTGSLLDAGSYGPFDYIDCCGVLHHLPDPSEGAAALSAALSPDGGLGFMVYGALGRTGVYPLQEAYTELFGDLPPKDMIKAARQVHARLPKDHPFARNPNLGDHADGDAGFYDLLLHSRDRAYSVRGVDDLLTSGDLSLVSFVPSIRYRLERFTPRPEGMDDLTAMRVAENLSGAIKTHVGYAVPGSSARKPASVTGGDPVPVLRGSAAQLAQTVQKTGALNLRLPDMAATIKVAKAVAPLLAAIDNKSTLSEITAKSGVDPALASKACARILPILNDWGLLHFSTVERP